VVGASVGEDLATSWNRVKGTIAGMAAGLIFTAALGPGLVALALSTALTAVIALAMGWGIPVARIGITLAILTVTVHAVDAMHYDMMRALNTGIGAVAGLAVSFFVWPVRAASEVDRAAASVLDSCRALIVAMEKGEKDLLKLEGKLHDALAAVVKHMRDRQREHQFSQLPSRFASTHAATVVRFGLDTLSTALGEHDTPTLAALRARLEALDPPAPPP
jgi:uncharacterized membrane protein YccC